MQYTPNTTSSPGPFEEGGAALCLLPQKTLGTRLHHSHEDIFSYNFKHIFSWKKPELISTYRMFNVNSCKKGKKPFSLKDLYEYISSFLKYSL